MKKLTLNISISAPRKKVWEVLWNEQTYTQWKAPFCKGSYEVSDWQEQSKILFLSPGDEGMYSIIEKKIVNEFMSFKHLGMVKDGIELPPTEETQQWAGALENYRRTEEGANTLLELGMDVGIGNGEEGWRRRDCLLCSEKRKGVASLYLINNGLFFEYFTS